MLERASVLDLTVTSMKRWNISKEIRPPRLDVFFYLVVLFYFRDLPYFIPKLEIHPSVPQSCIFFIKAIIL